MDLTKPFFVITGPSAVGKTTVAKALLATDLPLVKVVTTTTRPPRPGEVNGVSYHFVTEEQFEKFIAAGQMVEWAKYADHYYGSRRVDVDQIFTAERYPIWVVDVQGADYFERHYKDVAYTIFLVPSSFDILRKRMEKRGMPETEIRRRLKISREELAQAPKYDVRVVNYDGQLPKLVAEVTELVRRRLAQ